MIFRDENSGGNSEVPEEKKLVGTEKPSDAEKVSYYFETTIEKAEDLNLQLLDPGSSELELLALVSASECSR